MQRREKREEKKFLKKQAKERKIAIKNAKKADQYESQDEVKKAPTKEKRQKIIKRLIREAVQKLDGELKLKEIKAYKKFLVK